MGVIDKLRETIGGDGGPDLLDYRCSMCSSEFKSATEDVDDVACPNCDSPHVQRA